VEFAALGENLIACPKGGKIYQWANDTGDVAEPIANCPANVTSILVTEEGAVMAIGCNEEASGDFNPLCIRHSGVRDATGSSETVWNTAPTTTAREKILSGGGRLVGGLKVAANNLVFTNNQAIGVSYVGSLDEVYRFESVGNQCGLIGANAMTADNQTAYWVSPDYQLWGYSLGGTPQTLTTPFRKDLDDYLALSQQDKIVVTTDQGLQRALDFLSRSPRRHGKQPRLLDEPQARQSGQTRPGPHRFHRRQRRAVRRSALRSMAPSIGTSGAIALTARP
jgi:hypothetical protein